LWGPIHDGIQAVYTIAMLVSMFVILVSMLMIHSCGGQSTDLVTVFMIVVVSMIRMVVGMFVIMGRIIMMIVAVSSMQCALVWRSCP
jgi:uncharacterized lipoprotein YajG